ncbi:MAG TPA: Wzz/FepE/Etk N-terminal domain-containing protein, partial [Treponemataceae bacterium]|nr:Wzz/FepE/Etk N-terminal domain-containing protein [Treponemataceae bacterium]
MSELNTVPPSDCNNDDEISLLDLFAIIWKRKLFIIIFTVICAVGVVLYAYISIKLPPEKSYLPNKYTSTAIMMINSGS